VTLSIGDIFAKSVYHLHNGRSIEECWAYIDKLENDIKLELISQEEIDNLETDRAILFAMLGGYEQHFLHKFPNLKILPEYTTNIPINKKFRYVCRLDGRIINEKKENQILEIKTTTQIQKDLIIKLPVNFQILSYYFALKKWLHKPVFGVLYRHIKKPSIRMRQKETPQQFQKRVALEYAEQPEKYFHEEYVIFDKNVLSDFGQELYQKFADLEDCYKTNHWYKNEVSCSTKFGNCPYLQYCINPTQETLDTFYKIGE